MTVTQNLRKIQCKNVKEINFALEFEKKTPITGGCINRVEWTITGMRPGFDSNDQPNGEFVSFEAKLNLDPKKNVIYGVRELQVCVLTNNGAVRSDQFKDGDLHSATVTG